MLSLHPLFMFGATLLGVYVFLLGAQRFLDRRRGGRPVFKWKWHVALGYITQCAWVAGVFFGMFMVYLNWKTVFLPDEHAWIGLAVGVLALVGLVTGDRMNRVTKRRKWLPRVHGLVSTAALILAIGQIATGVEFYLELTGGL